MVVEAGVGAGTVVEAGGVDAAWPPASIFTFFIGGCGAALTPSATPPPTHAADAAWRPSRKSLLLRRAGDGSCAEGTAGTATVAAAAAAAAASFAAFFEAFFADSAGGAAGAGGGGGGGGWSGSDDGVAAGGVVVDSR
eukprot:jgi/Chrpa1/20037/Chrysochromulina_OHIO_Genome00027596-RA